MAAASGSERIWWIVLIVLVLGYLAGAWWNRRRSRVIGQWLQASLTTLGGRIVWRVSRSMSTGGEVTLTDAHWPFRQIIASYYLLTRELAPLWGIELLRGKRDLLAIRADLQVPPTAEYELVPLNGKLRKLLDQQAGEPAWRWQEMPAGLGLATRGEASRSVVKAMTTFAGRYGQHIERLSLHPRQPALVLFVRLTGLEKTPARELLRAVKEVAGA